MSDPPYDLNGVWFNLDDEGLADATKTEIMHGSDRSAAIVAGAFVEDYLTEALRKATPDDPKLFNELFKPEGGMLGSFGAKIRVGFLLQIYDQSLRVELDTISRIRNRFAHRRGVDGFTSEGVRGLVANLTAGETLRIGNTVSDDRMEAYNRVVFPWDDTQHPGETIHPFITAGATLRQRFTSTCMMFIFFFWLVKGSNMTPFIALTKSKDGG